MPIIKLTPRFIQQELICPTGKPRIEFCDSELPGLYIEVRAASPNQGTYYLRYKNEHGKTAHHKLGKTGELSLADARIQAITAKAELLKGNPLKTGASVFDPVVTRKKGPMTFADFFINRYMPHAKEHKKTFDKDLQYFNLRLNARFGAVPLNKITRSEIQAFHNQLKQEGLAPATANHYVKLIKHCFNLAIDWGLMETNPAVKVKLFYEDNQIERYLNEEELARLMMVLKTDDNRMICYILKYLISTGARLNEALQAKWVHVEMEKRLWRIPAQNAKSKKVRAVPLNDSALEVLATLNTQDDHEYLFINRLTGLPYKDIQKIWQRIRHKAGLPELRIHDLRHQFASFLVNNGNSLFVIGQILGHSTPSVTQRYAHLSTQSLQAAANAASQQLQAASGS